LRSFEMTDALVLPHAENIAAEITIVISRSDFSKFQELILDHISSFQATLSNGSETIELVFREMKTRVKCQFISVPESCNSSFSFIDYQYA